ncbi:MAG TPA: S-methyl-5-thioribose-1-phosphate isomerase [Chloroflexi bacterium]|nr:S-methyl-5-thioribose-1-phosphate isomerase [Chloroflexota bacterium]
MRTVAWNYDTHKLQMIDQRLLPGTFEVAVFDDYRAVAQAITDMVVRGAPAIGATAAFGMALAAQQSKARDVSALLRDLKIASDVLKQARPTAVNLAWAIDRISERTIDLDSGVDAVKETLLAEAQRIADEDVEINQRMARHGAELIEDGDTIIHHCNTGALATVDWGTALGVIRMAHEQGKKIHVLVDETRPRLQGSRLTAWELTQYGIPFDIISDNAAGYFLSSGAVQKCFVGSDRTAANGDVANKIGTYMLALAAHDNGIPFYPVVPTSTVDLTLKTGAEIPIEERNPSEVLSLTFQGLAAHPEGASARNPAFDVTPARLVTGIVTENGIAYPPFETSLAKMVKG